PPTQPERTPRPPHRPLAPTPCRATPGTPRRPHPDVERSRPLRNEPHPGGTKPPSAERCPLSRRDIVVMWNDRARQPPRVERLCATSFHTDRRLGPADPRLPRPFRTDRRLERG